jgi:UDP-N-acetylmuramate dehydrogenase
MEQNVLLSKFSNYKTGGPADFFVNAKNIDEVKSAIVWAKDNNQKIFILGGGTNILFPDDGFRGLVLKLDKNDSCVEGLEVRSGAGASVSSLLNLAIENELTGLEWAGGLPGTIGGAVRGNAGCFGSEIKDIVKEVRALDSNGEILIFNNKDCKFSYRHSFFKEEKLIILGIIMELKKDLPREKIKEIAESRINYRIAKQPLEYPNCGSVFKNVDVKKAPAETIEKFKHLIKTDPFDVIPTAALTDAAGLKGYTIGGAQVSTKHPNFVINIGNAKSADILGVINFVKGEIKNIFGVDLEVEIELVN